MGCGLHAPIRRLTELACRVDVPCIGCAAGECVEREHLDIDRLFVSRAFVDQGPTQKRIRPRAQGRAFQILKRACHMTIEVDLRGGGGSAAA